MTTTIDGTNITFVDGSAWSGSAGGVTPDYNSSNTATSFNIGHLILSNTIFASNGGGYNSGGLASWPLNSTQYYAYYLVLFAGSGPFTNVTYAASDSRLGSQSYYVLSVNGTGQLAGTWRGRGQATAAGVYQYYGYFTLLERVA